MGAWRVVLVTGGTGTIGRELVQRLETDASVREVVVLTRGLRLTDGSRPAMASPPAWTDSRTPVRSLRGDVCAGPGLGLASEALERLRAEVTDVLHCAAATAFTLPLDEARAANVEGTRSVLDFARGCPHLHGMACFSTVYVAGRRTGVFSEDDVADAGAGFVNTYEQAKCEMEGVVRERMGDLPLAILRSSTIAGDSRTGRAVGSNAVHHAVRLLYRGMAPMLPGRAGQLVDLVGVDYVAEAALALVSRFDPGATYHLCAGPAAPTLDELLDTTLEAFARFRPSWRRRSIEKPALTDPATYELFVRSVEETGNLVLRGATRSIQSFAWQLAHPKVFTAERTIAALGPGGPFCRPLLDWYPGVVRDCIETELEASEAGAVA